MVGGVHTFSLGSRTIGALLDLVAFDPGRPLGWKPHRSVGKLVGAPFAGKVGSLVESGAAQPPADVHDADDGARTGRRSVSQPASRDGPPRGLVCLDLLE
jgi:hypothetical protein